WELNPEASRPANVSSADAHAFAGLAMIILLPDPLISDRQTFIQRRIRFPLENFFDEGVVGITTRDALRCVEVIGTLEFLAGNLLHLADQRVDGDQFAGAEIDRRGDEFVAMRD